MGDVERVRPSEDERSRAAEVLQRACGEGRLTLEEYSVRVGAVWAAETGEDLERATSGLAATPVVGSALSVDSVLTVFSENKRRGRWRLRGGRLWLRTIFGSTELDLREVLIAEGQNEIEIGGFCLFGEIKVIVPEGVEVDFTGSTVFSARSMHLAAVPRVPGTPEVRVDLSGWFSNLEVSSKPYSLPSH